MMRRWNKPLYGWDKDGMDAGFSPVKQIEQIVQRAPMAQLGSQLGCAPSSRDRGSTARPRGQAGWITVRRRKRECAEVDGALQRCSLRESPAATSTAILSRTATAPPVTMAFPAYRYAPSAFSVAHSRIGSHLVPQRAEYDLVMTGPVALE
jgi:hypothetical protein